MIESQATSSCLHKHQRIGVYPWVYLEYDPLIDLKPVVFCPSGRPRKTAEVLQVPGRGM